jgi:hypothetical protein
LTANHPRADPFPVAAWAPIAARTGMGECGVKFARDEKARAFGAVLSDWRVFAAGDGAVRRPSPRALFHRGGRLTVLTSFVSKSRIF